MAWLFSCFRCKQKRQCQYSSPHLNHKIAVEKPVLRNASVQEAQDVIQKESIHSYRSSKQSLDQMLEQSSKQGNDADRSLFSLLKTETTCHSPKEQLSDKPLEREGLQQVMDEVKGAKDLEDEASGVQNLLNPSSNVRTAFDGLQVDSKEGQVEKGWHMGCLHSLLTKIECEGETFVLDDLTLQEQNKLDDNHGVDTGEPLSCSTKIGSQQCGIKASFGDSLSRFSPTAQKKPSLNLGEETDLLSPVPNLLARTFQNSRGCSSETKPTQSVQRRNELSESTPPSIEDCLLISRSKRSSKALSFSEFSLVETAADSKLTSKGLEFEKFETKESSVATRTIGTNKVTALRGAADKQISRKSSTNASGSLPTSSEQAISFSVSQDVALYDTDMEVDSKAVKSHLEENLHGRLQHGYVQTLQHNTCTVPLCADSTMECSQAFTYEDSYTGISEASQFSAKCNRERRVLDEVVSEPDIDQRSICSDASSLLTSPLFQTLSTRDQMFVWKKAHLQETPLVSPMLQDNCSPQGKSKLDEEPIFASTETAGWTKRIGPESINLEAEISFAGSSSKGISLPVEKRQFFANIASEDKLLPSKLSDDATSRPIRRFIDMSPESCTYSSIEHMREMSSDKFASPEAASFWVPSPETVTSKIPLPSPLPLGSVKKASSTQRIMPNLPQEMPSLLKSVQEIPCTNSVKQQSTPKTPSVSSSEVETPSSIQSVVSPADLEQDRPILGTVAAHWSHSSSKDKWWDGKGIPNSTNKYKEDQKVSWHATPFEVRLERALAKQGRVFQKKLFGGNMHAEMERRTEPITSSG